MRPTTGPSPFDELWDEMLRKYTRVSEEEAREGWREAYDAALHENAGGRLSTVQLLVAFPGDHQLQLRSGSVWPRPPILAV